MGLEDTFWDWLQPKFKKLPQSHVNRIESPVTPGFPDVEGCIAGRSFLTELKACPRPKKLESPLTYKIRTGQIIWHGERYRAGGTSTILIRVGSYFSSRMYLVSGEDIEKLVKITEHELKELSIVRPSPTFHEIVRGLIYPHVYHRSSISDE